MSDIVQLSYSVCEVAITSKKINLRFMKSQSHAYFNYPTLEKYLLPKLNKK